MTVLKSSKAESGKMERLITSKKVYNPTTEEKASILAGMTGVENLDSFAFYEAVAAETKIDAHSDVLTKEFLEILAKRYEDGRTVLDGHDSRHRIGATFKAFVQPHPEDAGHSQLIVGFYISPTAKMLNGNTAIDEINQGLVRRMSIGFTYAELQYIEEDDENNELGRPYFLIDAPRRTSEDRIEAYEISAVTMGAQPGAHIKELEKRGGTEIITTLPPDETNKPDKPVMEQLEVKLRGATKTIEVSGDSKGTVESLMAELETFREAAASEKKAAEEAWVKARLLENPELDAEAQKTTAAQLPISFLREETKSITEGLADNTLNPDPEQDEGDQNEKVKSPGTAIGMLLGK